MQIHNPAHPGEVLKGYVGTSEVTAFANKIGVDRINLSRPLNGHTGISATMALELEQTLNTSAEMWMNMQATHDLWTARQKARSPTAKRPRKAALVA
jgi:antitoxin HigA-1